jgi:hypothetical protein
MNRFILKIIFYKYIHMSYFDKYFVKSSNQNYALEIMSLSKTTSSRELDGVQAK